ncbi:calcium-binding protein [Neobacillus niacini]|uniref:calcium-binding protein n=1 Tax=Neobacillus niacini TaxID=86668 RepID=UPI00286D4E0F|nr:calcium-binding protein [Neobacillus niacini]
MPQTLSIHGKIIRGLESESDILEAWRIRIQQVVTFPFKAEIFEVQEYVSIIQQGDLLKVLAIDDIDDKYGIIAHARFGRKKVYFPLCELEAIDLSHEGKKYHF